ncbi:hypothetical protein [Paenibacillus algicola]|uniref:hypothetical protein n=1 Tax=Paenibacillus algicola TaxID=2565926 RepID=UPI0010FE5691|nr:hypothetical protein [Paenibacillus algicola]
MEKNKEIVFNATIFSAILAVIVGWFMASVSASSQGLNPDDRFIPFIILFLILYVFNVVVSIINYVLGRIINSLAVRLLIFNAFGIIIILGIRYILDDPIFLAAYSTFVLFSFITVYFTKSKKI